MVLRIKSGKRNDLLSKFPRLITLSSAESDTKLSSSLSSGSMGYSGPLSQARTARDSADLPCFISQTGDSTIHQDSSRNTRLGTTITHGIMFNGTRVPIIKPYRYPAFGVKVLILTIVPRNLQI